MRLQDAGPGKWQLFRIWASIGLQSFGGGASTTFLIQRAFIENHRWLSMEEFIRLWNLCILTPGINHVAAVQAVLRGVIPATGGIMLLVGLNFALPLIRRDYKEGVLYLLASSVLIIACALAVILLKLSVIIVLLAAVLLGALFFSPKPVSPLLVGEERGKQQ